MFISRILADANRTLDNIKCAITGVRSRGGAKSMIVQSAEVGALGYNACEMTERELISKVPNAAMVEVPLSAEAWVWE